MRILAAGLIALPAPAWADDTPQSETIKIVSRKNPGDLRYNWAIDIQTTLNGWLPAEPRLTDFTMRMLFADLTSQQSDEFLPDDWGVAIVGDTVDHTVKIRRGGYFDLPDLPKARDEGATLMFHAQTKRRKIGVAWQLRTNGHELSYLDFGRALDEVKGTQARIPVYRIGARHVKYAKVDAIKACFAGPEGRVEVDGAAPVVRGPCALLVYSPAMREANPMIRFRGELASLTLEESRDW